MHRSLVFIAAAAALAAAPAAAHARHDLSDPVRLAEVSADPRDGTDTIELRSLRHFTHLELRARAALVDIHGLGLRFHDGRVAWMDVRARIAPGERRTIELPREARRAEALLVDYGDPALRRRDRTPARLELYGATRAERGGDRYGDWYGDRYGDRRGDRFHDRDYELDHDRYREPRPAERRGRGYRPYRHDPDARF
jgi:hypothetical protein